jgi:hypothetical protein
MEYPLGPFPEDVWVYIFSHIVVAPIPFVNIFGPRAAKERAGKDWITSRACPFPLNGGNPDLDGPAGRHLKCGFESLIVVSKAMHEMVHNLIACWVMPVVFSYHDRELLSRTLKDIESSRPCHLVGTIQFKESVQRTDPTFLNVESILSLVRSYERKWTALMIRSWEKSHAQTTLVREIDLYLPNVRWMTLEFGLNDEWLDEECKETSKPWQISDSINAPNLISLKIERPTCPIVCTPNAFSNLESFSMTFEHHQFPSVIDLLASIPSIRDLDLRQERWHDPKKYPYVPYTGSLRHPFLPNLQRLWLRGISSSDVPAEAWSYQFFQVLSEAHPNGKHLSLISCRNLRLWHRDTSLRRVIGFAEAFEKLTSKSHLPTGGKDVPLDKDLRTALSVTAEALQWDGDFPLLFNISKTKRAIIRNRENYDLSVNDGPLHFDSLTCLDIRARDNTFNLLKLVVAPALIDLSIFDHKTRSEHNQWNALWEDLFPKSSPDFERISFPSLKALQVERCSYERSIKNVPRILDHLDTPALTRLELRDPLGDDEFPRDIDQEIDWDGYFTYHGKDLCPKIRELCVQDPRAPWSCKFTDLMKLFPEVQTLRVRCRDAFNHHGVFRLLRHHNRGYCYQPAKQITMRHLEWLELQTPSNGSDRCIERWPEDGIAPTTFLSNGILQSKEFRGAFVQNYPPSVAKDKVDIDARRTRSSCDGTLLEWHRRITEWIEWE